jgi:hypothetical protein
MTTRKPSRRLTLARRRQLELSAAVAREAVTQHHIASALKLIELGADRVSAIRMLDIYLRLHGITSVQAELLAFSVLAALGNTRPAGEATALLLDRDEGESEPTSLLAVVRRRLRGRVHHDLRRWVELATGAAQAGLMEIHVRHAMRFAEELVETHSVGQACALYADMAGVPRGMREPVLILLLERLAARELPRTAAGPGDERVALYPRPSARSRRAV